MEREGVRKMIAIDGSLMFSLFIGLAIGLVCGFGVGYFSAWLEEKVSYWVDDDGALSREELEWERYREWCLKHAWAAESRICDPFGLMHADD